MKITYLLNYLLTYLLHGTWEANRFSASQEIPRILWNRTVHCSVRKCPTPVPILSQLDPVHAPTSHFLKIHLIIILLSMPGSSKWSLSLRLPHQNTVYASPLPVRATCPESNINTQRKSLQNKKTLCWAPTDDITWNTRQWQITADIIGKASEIIHLSSVTKETKNIRKYLDSSQDSEFAYYAYINLSLLN